MGLGRIQLLEQAITAVEIAVMLQIQEVWLGRGKLPLKASHSPDDTGYMLYNNFYNMYKTIYYIFLLPIN